MEERQEKLCTTCHTLNPYSSFYKNRDSRDGYGHLCLSCQEQKKILNRERVIKQNNSLLEKFCYRCNTKKHISEFGARYETKDGRSSFCKACYKDKGTKPPSIIIDLPDGTRVCTKCNVAKPLLTSFRSSPSSKLGKEGQCRDCVQKGVSVHISKDRVLKVEEAKWCPRCKKEKPGKEFNKNKSSIDGRNWCCSECS